MNDTAKTVVISAAILGASVVASSAIVGREIAASARYSFHDGKEASYRLDRKTGEVVTCTKQCVRDIEPGPYPE